MTDTENEADDLTEDTGDGEYTSSDVQEEESSDESLYNSADLTSGAHLSEKSTLNLDLLEFDYSYGYDCQKYFNLTAMDNHTVIFSTGNFIVFFDTETKVFTFRRSALGGGVGHIRKNHSFPHFAVAECGRKPLIILYEWPSLDVVCVLKGGAAKHYANLDFNQDGDLLVSQSGEPDYLITVWDWQNHNILLRTKSYVNDVYRVKFSNFVPGLLVTTGVAHIKFWKMASTFTGLKLKGELGRFGKTEYSDIIGAMAMPDSKVVSGCSWGNILVWDDGLITFEVFRSMRRKCHDGPIVQFYYSEGELWTVSMDGHVKVWWFEKIDQADPPDDDRVIMVDPTYDFHTPGIQIVSVDKRPVVEGVSDTFWFAQDGNGGIWIIDLNTDAEPKPSVQLYVCHGGKVVGMDTCPYGPHVATLGEQGSFFIYQYITRQRVVSYKFPAGGAALIWVPLEIDPSGEIILAGFVDGQVRVLCVSIPPEGEEKFSVAQVIKPHNRPLVAMSLNPEGTLLVTAGSDKTIFVFKTDYDNHHHLLIPIGYYPTVDVATCITWHPTISNQALLGFMHGQMMEFLLPSDEQSYTGVSFLLELETKNNKFTTYKAQILRDIHIQEIQAKKSKKLAKKREDLEKIKKDNPGLDIDEETFLTDSDTEEELEPLFIPEVPNRVIWLKYTPRKTIWLSMGGYDAGYIYEYTIDQKEAVPVRFKLIEDGNGMEISSYVYSFKRQFLVLAMQDGSMRVVKVNPADYTDLSDYFELSMHDNQRGFVPKMCFSHDETFFFSCGHDGNIFSYKFQPEVFNPRPVFSRRYQEHLCDPVHDVDPDKKLSLEEVKIKAEEDRINKLANEHKHKVRDVLKSLKDRYKKLLARNQKLLLSQVIPRDELEPDQRVAEYVDKIFADKVDIVKRKLAFDVEKSRILVTKLQRYFIEPCDRHPVVVQGINDPDVAIMTVRQRKMGEIFYETLDKVKEMILEESGKGRPPERVQAVQKQLVTKLDKTESPTEFFLLSLSKKTVEKGLGAKLTRMLQKYRERKLKWKKRSLQWEEFLAKKPIPGKNHPDDEKFLAEAKISFGDYKLKESPDYKVLPEDRETTLKHYHKLLETRKKQYDFRHQFVETVFEVRDKKYQLIETLKLKQTLVDVINEELPESLWQNGPPIPAFNPNDYPEEKLQVHVVLPVEDVYDDDEEIPPDKYHVDKPKGDELERKLLSHEGGFKFENQFFYSLVSLDEDNGVADKSYDELIKYSETSDTPYESNLRGRRLNKLYFHQRLIISEMHESIQNFNDWIMEARKERLPILIRGNFIDIYIVCLNEELQILKNCEDHEDRLNRSVNEKLALVHDMEDTLDEHKIDKENHETKLENLKVEEGKIQEKFKMAVENNKFYDFLKKVFKKKFKLPKVRHDDDSSSSSSSSSEDSDYQDDAESVDSTDFGFIRLDLNVCPKGCELALFNFTIDLRSKRHALEQAQKEETHILDFIRKEIDICNRKMILLVRAHEQAVVVLEKFRREKQKQLNNVRCTVVLNMDQIYGNITDNNVNISDFLVFSRSKLSALYKRVTFLQQNALEEQEKHDTFVSHMVRMRKDILFMSRKAHQLKLKTKRLLKIKFGKEIDINELEWAVLEKSFQKNYVNELEEVMLKKLVYEVRLKTTDVKDIYIKRLGEWSKRVHGLQDVLSKEIKENTRKLELLSVLHKEKKYLAKFLDTQDKRRERIGQMEQVHEKFSEDFLKLQTIYNDQLLQIQQLREEIQMLRTKGMAQEVKKYQERMEQRRLEEEEEERMQTEQAVRWVDVQQEVVYEEERPVVYKTDITLPEFYLTETEDTVRALLDNLMHDVDTVLDVKSKENIARSILSNIMKCVSIQDFIKEIISNLPIDEQELTPAQKSSIQDAAQLLKTLQEPELSDETIHACVRDILQDTVSEIVDNDPHVIITKIMDKLLDSLPIDVVSSDLALDEIAQSMKKSMNKNLLDKEELQRYLATVPSEDKEEVATIIQAVLERVYEEGIDILFVINK